MVKDTILVYNHSSEDEWYAAILDKFPNANFEEGELDNCVMAFHGLHTHSEPYLGVFFKSGEKYPISVGLDYFGKPLTVYGRCWIRAENGTS